MSKQNQRPIPVTREMVTRAYHQVKRKGGSSGVDGQSLSVFERQLSNNLYKIWNRMSSGSYFPPAVKEVEIPKPNGQKRPLGIPTVGDRVAQTVVKKHIEERLEQVFDEYSYGYRPSRSAHDALKQVRKNCWNYDWVIDLDIERFFDSIAHTLLLQAVEKHVEEKWVKLYLQRWLAMPIEKSNGERVDRQGKGTPQGGVLSPLLANLFLHYVLDKWLRKHHPRVKFVRYADDIIIHCASQAQAEELLEQVSKRLVACQLSVNTTKTQLVYCKDYQRNGAHQHVRFDFLGYSFYPIRFRSQLDGRIRLGFSPAISKTSSKRLLEEVKSLKEFSSTRITLEEIAKELNPKLSGWIQYYGHYKRYKMRRVLYFLDKRVAHWLRKRYKRVKRSFKKGYTMLSRIYRENPHLFYHWQVGLHSF